MPSTCPRVWITVLCALSLLITPCRAQDAEPKLVVLLAKRLLDVVDGRMVSPARVLVGGERILAVGDFEVPEGATTIDLGDRTLVPGLIDCHTHLSYDLDAKSFDRKVRETAVDAALRLPFLARW